MYTSPNENKILDGLPVRTPKKDAQRKLSTQLFLSYRTNYLFEIGSEGHVRSVQLLNTLISIYT